MDREDGKSKTKCPLCSMKMNPDDLDGHIAGSHRHLYYLYAKKDEDGRIVTPAPRDVGIDKPKRGNPYCQGGAPGMGKKS